jgi:hypothetical protein
VRIAQQFFAALFRVPEGRLRVNPIWHLAFFIRPSGTFGDCHPPRYPPINRWAITGRPSGTFGDCHPTRYPPQFQGEAPHLEYVFPLTKQLKTADLCCVLSMLSSIISAEKDDERTNHRSRISAES